MKSLAISSLHYFSRIHRQIFGIGLKKATINISFAYNAN